MTSLAIVGSGLAGRSLVYALAKERKYFEKITIFSSDTITLPCSLNSTGVVAGRGISYGHSSLGNLLLEGFHCFSDHVHSDLPMGVEAINQYTVATSGLEAFKLRYPEGVISKKFLKEESYLAEDKAYLIDPKTYTDWLLETSNRMQIFNIEQINDMVLEVTEGERLFIRTLNNRNYTFDKVVFTCGNYNRFWAPLAAQSKLKTSKPIQGSYFQFNDINWEEASFSLTLNGDNLIWNKSFKRLLIGSTSNDSCHFMAPIEDLKDIYERLREKTNFNLPRIEDGIIKVGLREKAQKREPYIIEEGNCFFMGGLYKNGYSLSLLMARNLSRRLL